MKTIKEAPKYQVNDKGQVSNIKTGKVVKEEKNYVRLSTENGRIRLNTKELIFKYFKNSEVEKESKSITRASQQTFDKKGSELSSIVKEEYDKNPADFSINKFSKKVGVSYGRVWGIIKTYKNSIKNEN